MALNDLAREKLRILKRGEALTRQCKNCPHCDFRMSRHYRRCASCRGKVPVTCRLCEEPLTGRRTSWCESGECMDAYYMVTSSKHLRAAVFGRDHGVCAECGIDCEALEQRVNAMDQEQRNVACKILEDNGFTLNRWYGRRMLGSLWDADHVDALNEGGSSWLLGNVQTLCHPCHKEKTADQAGRKGKQRRLIGRKYLKTQEMLRLSGVTP